MKQKTRNKRDLVLSLAGYALESRISLSQLYPPPSDFDDGPDRKTPGVQVSEPPPKRIPPIGIYGTIPVSIAGPIPKPIFFTMPTKGKP